MRTSIQRCLVLAVATVCLLPIPTVLAQKSTSRFEELSGIIKPGDRVTVSMNNGERITDRVVEVNAASIVLANGKSQPPRTIPSLDVTRIETKDRVANGIKIGAGVGAGAGLAIGLLVNTYCYNEVGSCPGAVVALTAAGAAGGAAAGWGMDSARGSHILYDRSGARIERSLGTEFFTSVDYSRFSRSRFPTSIGTPQQISISAGIGRHFFSGLGVEGEIQRTVQSAVKQNPCEKALTGPQAGVCIGPGLEGPESALVGTGRVVYTLRSVRFQPFISGGYAVLQTVERYAFVNPSSTPTVSQYRWRYTENAMPVGGGFRVALTPSITIRPAVTYYIGAERTSVSVGVVYRH